MTQPPFLKFKHKSILIIGDLILDEYILGESNRISPEAPIPIVRVHETKTVLGGAANCAAAMSAMGAKPTLIGLVGNDKQGDQLKKICLKYKIKLKSFDDKRATTLKTRVLGLQQQLLRIDREETHQISQALEKQILQKIEKIIFTQEAVLISDYNKGLLTKKLCQKVITLAHKHKKPVLVDPKVNNYEFYKNCDYISPNWLEGKALSGFIDAKPNLKDIKKVALKIAQKINSHVFLTLGALGAFFQNKNLKDSYYVKTEAKEVFDVSGAGDTMISWSSMGIASGFTPEEALLWANRAAGLVVAKQGTSIIYAGDIIQEQKILNSLTQLKQVSESLHHQGKVIVSINGAFDLLHSGHMKILQEAKNQGDVLVVGLNTDESIQKYKDPKRPIVEVEERAAMLLNTRWVDFVYLFSEKTPHQFLKNLKPHVHVNGSEYGKNCIEASLVKKLQAKLHIINLKKGLSTSRIVEKIKNL